MTKTLKAVVRSNFVNSVGFKIELKFYLCIQNCIQHEQTWQSRCGQIFATYVDFPQRATRLVKSGKIGKKHFRELL